MYLKTYDMGIEINVALNGQHYFATSDRSIGYDKNKAKKLYEELKSIYTEEKGFRITLSMCNTTVNH